MPLSDDQRALLRLLAQREEGYEDIAALMGLSVGEVRSRVKGALKELDEGEPAAGSVAGRASSSSRAAGDEPRPVPPAAEAPSAARAAPVAAAEPRSPAAASRSQRGGRPRISPPKERRRLVELIGGVIVLLLIVLFATGAIDIDGDDSSDGSGPSALEGAALEAENGKLTQAALEPVDGGDAQGRAVFGRLGKQVVLQVLAEGLEPSASGETYAIWFYRSPKLALRIGAVKAPDSGRLAVRFPVPAELLALVANGAFPQIHVTRTSDAAYKAEVAAARRKQRLPRYTGETVLQGEITGPLAEAGSANGG